MQDINNSSKQNTSTLPRVDSKEGKSGSQWKGENKWLGFSVGQYGKEKREQLENSERDKRGREWKSVKRRGMRDTLY